MIDRWGGQRSLQVHFSETRWTQFALWRYPTTGDEDLHWREMLDSLLREELRAGRDPWTQGQIDWLVRITQCLAR